MNYKDAGVDTEKAASLIRKVKPAIEKTFRSARAGVPTDSIGGFAAGFRFHDASIEVLSAADGVGTKIELYRQIGDYAGIGQDLVAMCVNDLYCAGGVPAFFLDYISCGKLADEWYVPVLLDIARACEEAGLALIGGESAEHPGVMADDDFDLAGFCVGTRKSEHKLPCPEKMNPGNLLVGIPSSGPHSNGFSLIRKLLREGFLADRADNSAYIRKNLLTPTRIYAKIPDLYGKATILGMAHITGGGFYENIPRMLPPNLGASIEKTQVLADSFFAELLQHLEAKDCFSTFNMGTGMVLVVPDSEALHVIQQAYPDAEAIGQITETPGVHIEWSSQGSVR